LYFEKKECLTKFIKKIMMKADIEDLEKELWLRQREELIWETKDGTQIPLKEMSTEHIVNAINYFNRLEEEREIVLENQHILWF
jgi:hypothetical protein